MHQAAIRPLRYASSAAIDSYAFLDHQINASSGTSCGFGSLVTEEPFRLETCQWDEAAVRYHRVRAFQEITLSLFNASLRGAFDPAVATLVINELPPHLGVDYYKALTPRQHSLPAFFRTDEVGQGKICEIQSPGSLWGVHEQLYNLYAGGSPFFATRSPYARYRLSEQFARHLRSYLAAEPLVHHYMDGSTNPSGMRFFIQQTRAQGIRYYGYDRGLAPHDCNFIRHHIYATHWCDKHVEDRMARCDAGTLRYDLPPSVLFSQKIPMIFPFWDKTKAFYSDDIRTLFPYTQLITPEGIVMEDGAIVSIDQFCQRPRSQRAYYIKYASSDLTLCSRGKGVFYAKTFSREKMRAFFDRILQGYPQKKYWVLQTAHVPKNTTTYLTRDNARKETPVHAKMSSFYGPDGLMGMLLMQHPFYKVHGSQETIATVVI